MLPATVFIEQGDLGRHCLASGAVAITSIVFIALTKVAAGHRLRH
jgi:hypothetical protein